MDLKEFSDPLPKPWLNINANSVHVGPGAGAAQASQFTMLGSWSVSNVLVGSITGTAASTGSLRIPPLPVGATVRVKAYGSGAFTATTFGVSLVVDTVPVSGVASLAGTIPAVGSLIEAILTVRPGAQATACVWLVMGTQPPACSAPAPFAYDNTRAHNFDVLANFGVAAPGNNFLTTGFYVDLGNAN